MMIFGGEILDTIFKKVPHRFLGKIWVKKLSEYLSIKKKK